MEILRSVNGKAPESISIGMKIPAIDYASSITKLKALNTSHEMNFLRDRVDSFNQEFLELSEAVKEAASIQA